MSEESKNLSLLTVLGWLGATAVVCAGAGWTAGRTIMNDELKQYQNAESWKVPDAISKLSSLSSTLDVKLKKLNDYEELLKSNKVSLEKIKSLSIEAVSRRNDYESLKRDLELKLKTKDEIIDELNKVVTSIRGEIVTIYEGEAIPVGHKTIKVGVSSTSSYWAAVNSGDFHDSTMSVGDSFKRKVDNSTYVITLVSITDRKASFTYDIIAKQ